MPRPLPHCLSKAELMYFLDLITAKITQLGETIFIVHATEGKVYWIWDGMKFCMNQGFPV